MMMGDLWRVGGNIAVSRAIGKVGGNIAVSRAIGKTQQPFTMLNILYTCPIFLRMET